MAKHIEIGKIGEQMALNYLKLNGYLILEINYRFKHLEIDILATDKEELVVVEVKTRQSQFMAKPSDTVSKSKQKLIIKAANEYIRINKIDLNTRFDIISVLIEGNRKSIDHIKDAFYPV